MCSFKLAYNLYDKPRTYISNKGSQFVFAYMTLATFFVVFCLVAKRLERTFLTAPIVFIGFGVLLSWLGTMPTESSEAALHLVAEVALIILLFLDAAKIDPLALKRRHVWPTRMLVIGLPLAFLMGTGLGWLLLPGWPMASIALVAAILVPTDAALGQPVIRNLAIPERPRRALTVESGLNDGLTLPLILMMAALAAPHGMAPAGGWIAFGVKQILLGPLAGVTIGFIGGYALLWAKRADTTAKSYEGIAALALAALAYLSAILIGGNGLIAAFAGGLGFGAVVRGKCAFVYEFTESEGQILSWSAFFLLGAVLVPEAMANLTGPSLALILGSLFFVRPIAIWLSLVGTDAQSVTRLFFGWFGPRGLATALFALLVYEQLEPEIGVKVLHLAINAVWISALLHGITAAPGAAWYASRIKKAGNCPETLPLGPSRHIIKKRKIANGDLK